MPPGPEILISQICPERDQYGVMFISVLFFISALQNVKS